MFNEIVSSAKTILVPDQLNRAYPFSAISNAVKTTVRFASIAYLVRWNMGCQAWCTEPRRGGSQSRQLWSPCPLTMELPPGAQTHDWWALGRRISIVTPDEEDKVKAEVQVDQES